MKQHARKGQYGYGPAAAKKTKTLDDYAHTSIRRKLLVRTMCHHRSAAAVSRRQTMLLKKLFNLIHFVTGAKTCVSCLMNHIHVVRICLFYWCYTLRMR